MRVIPYDRTIVSWVRLIDSTRYGSTPKAHIHTKTTCTCNSIAEYFNGTANIPFKKKRVLETRTRKENRIVKAVIIDRPRKRSRQKEFYI